MSLNIYNNTVNGYKLGSNYSKNELVRQDLIFEFDRKNPHKLVTVSAKSIKEFILNGDIINFEKFKDLISIKKDDILFECHINYTSYLISSSNLVVNISENDDYFLQVLVFDKSLKEFYENGLIPIRYKDKKIELNFGNRLNFKPYKIFDKFPFGMKFDDFVLILGGDKGILRKRSIEVGGFVFSFKEDSLCQILLDRKINKDINIFIEDFCITNEEEISEAKNKYPCIQRRDGRVVFQDFGFSVDKLCQEYYFFSENFLSFWSNPHRPITSW